LRASTIPAGEVEVKEKLRSSYEIKDLGEAKYILGMKIERTDDGSIKLFVTNFIRPYLHQFFDNSHGPKTSLKPLKRPFD